MSIPPLPSLPPLPALGIPTLLRALVKRPSLASGPTPSATYRLDRIDRAHVRRYCAAFGFAGDALPLTYLYLVAQRAQLATLVERPIPFRIPGLIHVENRLDLHEPVQPDTALALTTTLVLPPPAPNGAVLCVLETRASDGERLIFSCDSTYLIKRGERAGRASGAQAAPPDGEPIGQWWLAPDSGRRYAALSGDWNPIHLWPLSARLMGMRQPIIHGMHSVAMACAWYQKAGGKPATSLVCRFKKPIPLGSRVTALNAAPGGRLIVVQDNRIAIDCDIRAADSRQPACAAPV